MDFLRGLSETFWSPSVWLPPNTTWNDVANGSRPDVKYMGFTLLLWTIPGALLFIIIRYLIDKHLILPLGIRLGISSSKPKRAAPNPTLEAAYKKSKRLGLKTASGLAKQVDLTEREVERWWRLRRAQDKPSNLVKFRESAFRFLYYLCSFVYGLYALWDKPWLWDFKFCWYGHPHQSVDNDVCIYCFMEVAFYVTLTFTLVYDVKRKDFWQMVIHHMATLTVSTIAWVTNSHRIGSLVFLVHDFADVFMELSKIANYAKYQKLCDSMFFTFVVVWIVTRLGIFPRIIYSCLFEAPKILSMFPVFYLLNCIFIVLFCLHLLWTYAILQVILQILKSGHMERDARSSSSEESDTHQPLTNGSTIRN